MTELLFYPNAVVGLTQVLIYLVILGYLLSVWEKSAATWWLVGVFVGFTLFFLNGMSFALYNPPPAVVRVNFWLFFLGTGTACFSLMHFAYSFLEQPYEREAHAVLWVSGLLLAVNFGHIAWAEYWSDGTRNPDLVHTPLMLGFIIWTVIVLLRKVRRARRGPETEGSRRAVRAYRAYALALVLLVVFLASQSLASFDLLDDTWQGGLFVLLLACLVSLAVVYINHAPEPTTFRVKLVGLSLISMMGVIIFFATLVFQEVAEEQAEPTSPQREALRFTPDGVGGYVATAPQIALVDSLGDLLGIESGAYTRVALGFDFPFYGVPRSEITVDEDPVVTFGGGVRLFSSLDTTTFGVIAPLLLNLNPDEGDAVSLHRAGDRATITWRRAARPSGAGAATVQLVLHADGVIDFVYGDIASDVPRPLMRGLAPGGAAPSQEARSRTASLSDGLPARIAPNAVYTENYNLAYRRKLHALTSGLIWLTLGAAAFALIVIPFLFHGTLFKPLEGLRAAVRRVDQGDLEAEVPVGVRDEIGFLAEHFNRMTQSLRRYSGEMEALVGERTEALERSLADLRATQQQLVQQEKLASLGALTAGIAHEIKNPLNFVNNFAGLSRELVDEAHDALGRGDAEEARAVLADLAESASKIEEHGRRADAIVRSMMQHARGGDGAREPVDLNAFVDEYVDLAFHGRRARDAAFDVDLDRDYDDEAGTVTLVPQDIGRVLINLLSNAFDAVIEQGRDRRPEPAGEGPSREGGAHSPCVRVSTRRAADAVEIRVVDNGPGIPPDVREKIFEPFFTTKPTGSGTGLGLSMSYDIVTQGHGGALSVESAEGEGATFIVSLPLDHTFSGTTKGSR